MEKCVELSNFQFLDNTWTNFIRCCKSSHRQNFGLQNYPVTFSANKDHVIRWLHAQTLPIISPFGYDFTKLRETNRISKGLFTTIWSAFYECWKDLFTTYKPIDSAVHKTVHKFSAPRNTNMFALFGVSCARFAVTISPA
jgi:hypothetical protein